LIYKDICVFKFTVISPPITVTIGYSEKILASGFFAAKFGT